jgi:hypothetical protein
MASAGGEAAAVVASPLVVLILSLLDLLVMLVSKLSFLFR